MEVIKAKSAGFCFGVKKAMETVYQQIFDMESLALSQKLQAVNFLDIIFKTLK